MKKRLLALILTLVMVVSILPTSVLAEQRDGTAPLGDDVPSSVTATANNVTVNKYVTVDGDGSYSLTMEAYAADKVTTTTTTTPLDIVLVLDVSGSMKYDFEGNMFGVEEENMRLTALKSAVNGFIDSVAASALETKANHQIGIVTFAQRANTVSSLMPVTTSKDLLKGKISELSADGVTRADLGMKTANDVLDNAQQGSKKIVIMFTDGQPCSSGNSYQADVAHDAIKYAKEMKDAGSTVYTIGIFDGANPSDTDGQVNKYMNAMSSNYPSAVSTREWEEGWFGGGHYEYSITLNERAQGNYYFASSSAEGLNDVFQNIANSETSSTLKVNPDETAVLSDTLSQYFNFPEGLTGDKITVQRVPVSGKVGDLFTWNDGGAEDISDVVKMDVDEETGSITVVGFDYKKNAVTETTEDGVTTYSGSKLVVTFPIEVDIDACLAEPIDSHYYPTNSTASGSQAGLSYKGENSESNDTSTKLSRSPEVLLEDLDANGTDVTVEVFVDGEKVSNPLDYVTIERHGGDSTYYYFKQVDLVDGRLTYDFNYNPNNGHNCVDLKLEISNNAYVLQGVRSYQSYGNSGTENVKQEGPSYKIDNVMAARHETNPDCTIYLRSKYSVEYYQDGDKLTETPYVDSTSYLAGEDISNTTAEGPTAGNSAWMNWMNNNCKTSIDLPTLPTVASHSVAGWYLGSATNTTTEYNGTFNAINEASDTAAEDADDNVIRFYAVATLNTHTITINYVDEANSVLKTAYTDTKNTGYNYSFDVSSGETGDIPFIIDKEGTQYVFDHFTEDSDVLSGTLNANVEITAVYLVDENKNNVPDVYEATVTYKVVNGTWPDDTTADKTADFTLRKFDAETNAWVAVTPVPTLGETLPTGMKPDAGYANSGSWNTAISSETTVIDDVTYTYTFGTKLYTITINYVDGENEVLKTAYTVTQNAGYNYSFDVSSGETGDIPFIIGKEGTQYVFDHFTEDSDVLSGTLSANVEITAVYLVDENKNNVPDVYEATVTYKVVNGTWSDDTTADKTADFTLRKFDADTNAWVAVTPVPTLGETLPTGMKPDVGYANSGSWNTEITSETTVTGDVTYTYTFSTKLYKLIYDVNGGTADTGPATKTDCKANEEVTLDTSKKPTHSDVDNTPVVFIGWSLNRTNDIYEAGENYGSLVEEVTFDDQDITVYAVWGYDTNGDEIPDATQVMVEPADITVYVGGNGGYEGVVNGSGTITGSNSLPEPGFYFTLPYDMNEAISEAENLRPDQAVNLANHLKLTARTGSGEPREWTLRLYDPDGTSDVDGRYVYSFVVSGNQEPVRMEFTDAAGNTEISDNFEITNSLFQRYTMAIYKGNVQGTTVEATTTGFADLNMTAPVGQTTGTLTIRGVTGEEDTTSVKDSISAEPENVTAVYDQKPTYYINGSQIEVTNQDAVQLLVDEIVDQEGVHETLLDMANVKVTEDMDYEFKYLDLVDTSNGNVWVTMGKGDSLTVYWPYPDGTNANDDFTIVHYKGLDREFNLNNLAGQEWTKEVLSTEDGTLQCTRYGIKFNVSSFSPFVLIWNDDDNNWPPIIIPDVPEDNTPNWLNLDDHYAYIVGYDDGMVKPGNNITRAEVATIFFRLLTDEAREYFWSTDSGFSDVKPGDWYNNAVSTMVNAGIITGYSDGTFKPNANITRAEFATIAARFLSNPYSLKDRFYDTEGHWAEVYINRAAEIGWIGGYPDGSFKPDQYITRAEAVTLVNNVLGRAPHEDHLLPDMIVWPDNPKSAWYYEDIQEATNSHDYRWSSSKSYEIWTELLENRQWSKLEKEWANAYSAPGGNVIS